MTIFSWPRPRMISGSTLIALSLLMSACVATPYVSQHKYLLGGYSDKSIESNIFEIRFRGNAFSSREQVIDFALLRSAEVAIENHCAYFSIIDATEEKTDKSDNSSQQTYLDGAQLMRPVSVYGNFSTDGGTTFFLQKPRVSNRILCFKKRPDIEHHLYDPRFVILSLRTKYGLGQYSACQPKAEDAKQSTTDCR